MKSTQRPTKEMAFMADRLLNIVTTNTKQEPECHCTLYMQERLHMSPL